MAKYIVQHRRGTVKQWAEQSTLIPMEGELVIEIDETNSLHKLKIGDGIHTYSELAYLQAGDEIVTQVLAKALPRVVTITLDIDKWIANSDYYSQTVALDSITQHSRLDLQPDVVMLAELKTLGVSFVTENINGTISVHSVGNKPTETYTMQATVVETDAVVELDKIVGIPVGAAKGEVAKADLAYDVQASLDKADSAIQSIDGLATEDYVDDAIAAIPTPDVSGQINTHNTATDSHNDIRLLIDGLDGSISVHEANASNPHGVTAAQVGLGDVENKSSATIRGEITKTNVTTALGYTPLNENDAYTLPAAGSDLGGVKSGGDVTISDGIITVNDDSHNHTIANVDGLADAIEDAKTNDVSGNEIQRVYTSMIPYGVNIEENSDLNTTEFLEVGNYYCSQNSKVSTLTNCPTTLAFMMQVYSPLSTTIDNETTKTWVYRLRKLITHRGVEYYQYVNSGSTAGEFTFGDWVQTANETDLAKKADKATGVFYIEGSGTTDTTNKVTTWTGSHDDITSYYDGLMIAYKIGVAASTTTTLNINGLGAVNVVRNATTAVSTVYPVNSVIFFVYTTDSDGTAYWKAHEYDSNTRNTVGDYRKNGTKLYFVGTTSSDSSATSSYATSYTNSYCYVGTDNCLYSDGEKVAVLSDFPYADVRLYGAKGDGTTDDTAAFQSALAANRVVYVPEGTYILSDTLLIEENCCLELSQAAVLQFTQTDTNCITMLRLASIKGNHATIFVPYTFNANVINADTRDDEANLDADNLNTSNASAVPPFTKWDPQWKMSRYVTDINICKPNSAGFHYSDDGVCYGTAVFMGCYEGIADFMWGVSMSGVRIAGGFTYGIRIYNDGATWNHDMRVEAVIDGCETGVSVENCNLAHLAVTIQPRPAADGAVYAKYGIKLVDSLWVDLSSSYVWDWTTSNTLVGSNAEYQHIAMYGDCSGVNIYDASTANSNYFWQRIYYDNLASMLNATVHGSKGKIPIDPKYAFYKNYRQMGYEFQNSNLTWRDYHNMVRYDVPVNPQNAYNYPDRLYKIGYFTIGSDAENPITDSADTLQLETVTIEENGYYGLMGWSNLYCGGSSVQHYWCPLGGVYENRVPVYFYSKSGNTFTLYRLVTDMYDIQHIYNCRVSITNARRFIFDFADMGAISDLDTASTYLRITPNMQTGTPKLAGQYTVVGGKPIVCTANATWSAQGIISTAATTKQIALEEDVDEKLNSLTIKSEQADFILSADGEYVSVADFTDVKSPYQENVWCNSGTMTTLTSGTHIWIEARVFSKGDVVRIKGVDFTSNYPGKARVDYFNKSDGTYKGTLNMASLISSATSGTAQSFATYNWDASTATLTLTFDGSQATSFCNAYTFAFGGGLASGYDIDSVIMTVNEEISYHDEWQGDPKRLDESLYAQSVMLTSPNGNTFKLTVKDDGTLSTEAVS